MIFVRYRKDAHRSLEVARLEARNLNHNYVGTEHLLLALTVGDFGVASSVLAQCGITEAGLKRQVVRERGAPQDGLTEGDAEALAAIGIDLDEVRHRVDETFGGSALEVAPVCPAGTPFTDKALRTLHATPRHARRLGHRQVGPEHLLLALMDDEGALSVRLIQRLGTTPKDLRDRTLAAVTST